MISWDLVGLEYLVTSRKYRIMCGSVWITIFCHEWGDSAMIFTSDGVASENHCPVASRVTKQSLFMLTHTLFYFFTYYFMSSIRNSNKNTNQLLISKLSSRTVFSDLTLSHRDSWSLTSREHEVLALWRHTHWLFLTEYKNIFPFSISAHWELTQCTDAVLLVQKTSGVPIIK